VSGTLHDVTELTFTIVSGTFHDTKMSPSGIYQQQMFVGPKSAAGATRPHLLHKSYKSLITLKLHLTPQQYLHSVLLLLLTLTCMYEYNVHVGMSSGVSMFQNFNFCDSGLGE